MGKYYIAYGSNTDINAMEYRCPNSTAVCTGIIKGYKLEFYQHADIVECKDNTVPCLVWEIADDDWDMLDMYEGYPSYYTKKEIPVTIDGDTEIMATVYVMKDTHGLYPPEPEYFQVCVSGYNTFKMDTTCLFTALSESYLSPIARKF